MASPAEISRIAINNILLATDFSAQSRNALTCAASLAQRCQARLFLTHVLPSEGAIAGGEGWPALSDVVRHSAERSMARLENLEELKSTNHEVILRSGDPWRAIQKVLKDKNIDLIVMGTHGYGGMAKLVLGSTAERVIRHATCPVLTVGPHAEFTSLSRLHHILYATDFSHASSRALMFALSLAEEDRADLTLLHVIKSRPASESELLEWKQKDHELLQHMIPAGMDLANQPEIEIEAGIPDAEIVRLAEARKVDLLVMGCHHGGAVSTHVPWTTLHHVLQHARCPVLTISCGDQEV